jgi:hypothetical protein
MKIGDMVRTVRPVHTNPAVHEKEIAAGYVGVVLAIRPDTLNNPPLSLKYVDVLLSVGGEAVKLGNYTDGHFEVVSEH